MTTESDAAAAEETKAAIESDLAQLAKIGIGCPRAVQLGGPGVVRDWIDGEFARIEAYADAIEGGASAVEAAEAGEEVAAAEQERDDEEREAEESAEDDAEAELAPYTLAEIPGVLLGVVERLDALEVNIEQARGLWASERDAALGELEQRLGDRIGALEVANPPTAADKSKGKKKE